MKIKVIAAYFGKLPNYFHLFLESCSYNPEFNWLIFTDDKTKYNYPENVKPIYASFESIQKRINQHIGDFALCHKPYKLCDYRPSYGLIFRDYLNDVDYWGHCDIDLIWGNLFKFLQTPLEKKYDRILGYGHLSLYKNNERVNNYFKLPFKGINYKYVFTHKASFGFDEKRGINKLFQENGIDYWHQEIMLDIKRPIDSLQLLTYNSKNYPNQKFLYKNGTVLRAFPVENSLRHQEAAYIHLQQRKMVVNVNNFNKFQICNESFEDPLSNTYDNYRLHDKKLLIRQKRTYLKNALIYKVHRILNLIQT